MYKLLRYLLLLIILFFVTGKILMFILVKPFLAIGINITDKLQIVSAILSFFTVIMIFFMEKQLKESYTELFEDDVVEEVVLAEDDTKYDFKEEDAVDTVDIKEPDTKEPDTSSVLNVETKPAVVPTTSINVDGDIKPVQVVTKTGDADDLEVQEIERLLGLNEEMIKKMTLMENSLRQVLEDNNIANSHITMDQIVSGYTDKKEKIKKEQKQYPFLLIDKNEWINQSQTYSTGCMSGVFSGSDEYMDISELTKYKI